jgi:hypothetical protein
LERCSPDGAGAPTGPDEEIGAIAKALQGLRLTVALDGRAPGDLVGVVQGAVCDATWAAVPRLRDQGPAIVTIRAIDGEGLVLSASVPLAVATVMEQSYIVRIDEGKAQALVVPTSGTTFTIRDNRLAVIEPEPEAHPVE